MRRSALTALCLLALFQMIALPAMAEKRVAFEMGNARHEKLDALRNPKRDAAVIADRMKDLGFEVFELFDAETLSGWAARLRTSCAPPDGECESCS
jgi:hypothetical protein